MTGPEYRRLLESLLAGVDPSDEQGLIKPARECSEYREELEAIQATGEMLRAALAPRTDPAEAARLIVATIAEQPSLESRPTPRRPWRPRPWRSVLAAGIALTVGLLGGFEASRVGGRTELANPVDVVEKAALPIQVAELKGEVLVKRAGSSAWGALSADSAVRLGDLFVALPSSEARLALNDGSTLVLEAGSRLCIERYDEGVELSLTSGRLRASLHRPHGSFAVVTPGGRLEALGTEFTVDVE